MRHLRFCYAVSAHRSMELEGLPQTPGPEEPTLPSDVLEPEEARGKWGTQLRASAAIINRLAAIRG